MTESFVTFDPTGYWEGSGIEFDLLRDSNTIVEVALKLTKLITKYQSNVYLVTDTYYYEDGSINYGPANYVINTDGSNTLLTPDDTGAGIDSWLFNSEQMTFSYEVNGLPVETDPKNKAYTATYNLVKKGSLILDEQAVLFKNVDTNIKTLIVDNKITGSDITEADFPNLEFIVDNNKTLDFADLKIFLNDNGSLKPIVVPGVYDIVKTKYDAAAQEAVIDGSKTFEPFKDGVLDCATIGQIIDALTNNETYGILKVFSMTLADTTM
jgi:hypothetical protein